MESQKKSILRDKSSSSHPTPGERAAGAVLAVIAGIKSLISSFKMSRPCGQVCNHRGRPLPERTAIRFPNILIVDDDPQTAHAFVDIIRNHYVYGNISIYLAYCFRTAESFFRNEDINLVIMDSDLNDEQGNGIMLTRKFIGEKPGIIVLANSSSGIANSEMESSGATRIIGKNAACFQAWLHENDGVTAD